MNKPKEYTIEEKDLLAIIQYLGTKPYAEVSGAIKLLSTLKPTQKVTVIKDEKEAG